MQNENKNRGILHRWRDSRYFLISIGIMLSLVTATVGVSVTLLSQQFPTGPAAAIPIVHINSDCNSTSAPLTQQAYGAGVFMNASGTFIANGTLVSILYYCGNNSASAVCDYCGFLVTQETPPKPAPATPTLTEFIGGTLYVILQSDASLCSNGYIAHGGGYATLSDGIPVTLQSGRYDYCLVFNSYTTQLLSFSVTWTS